MSTCTTSVCAGTDRLFRPALCAYLRKNSVFWLFLNMCRFCKSDVQVRLFAPACVNGKRYGVCGGGGGGGGWVYVCVC